MRMEHCSVDDLVDFEELSEQRPHNFSVYDNDLLSSTQIIDLFDHEYTPASRSDILSEMEETDSHDSNSSEQGEVPLTRKKSSRPHVTNRRRRRGERSAL